MARAVVREYPASAPVAYALSGAAALVQIPRKAHFPSDVALGIVIGLVSEKLVALAVRGLMRP